ncbi:hypothetical protein J6590_043957 [Homalodisca vitripennis]|nr:hypothetical protein J6590_043957 [Homalodisca vitripennis]
MSGKSCCLQNKRVTPKHYSPKQCRIQKQISHRYYTNDEGRREFQQKKFRNKELFRHSRLKLHPLTSHQKKDDEAVKDVFYTRFALITSPSRGPKSVTVISISTCFISSGTSW